ncbi:MAG TPA: hypothetical protein VN841_17235 [Bryobacteraceae bacterium]|nr:hypothetical protein [Bryobacteraceae bacterium]
MTLDDDVEALLEREQRERGSTLKEIVNTALRQGLAEMQRKPEPRKPFRTKPLPVSRCLLPSLDDISEVLAIAESENYK